MATKDNQQASNGVADESTTNIQWLTEKVRRQCKELEDEYARLQAEHQLFEDKAHNSGQAISHAQKTVDSAAAWLRSLLPRLESERTIQPSLLGAFPSQPPLRPSIGEANAPPILPSYTEEHIHSDEINRCDTPIPQTQSDWQLA